MSIKLILSLILYLTSGVLHAQNTLPQTISVHFIDVGQGDSIFITSSAGTNVLIDGGNENGNALAYLQALGITHIDAMIATHAHDDHIGGLIEIMYSLPTAEIWTNGAIHGSDRFARFLDAITANDIVYHEAGTGDMIRVDDLRFDVLSGLREAHYVNDTSLVLRLMIGDIAFMFTGDASVEIEHEIMHTTPPDRLRADVLKLGHHGSRSATSQAFIDVVQPRYAIYSAGRQRADFYVHPDVINRLKESGISVSGTDIHHTIVITTNGTHIDVQTHVTTLGLAITNQWNRMREFAFTPESAQTPAPPPASD